MLLLTSMSAESAADPAAFSLVRTRPVSMCELLRVENDGSGAGPADRAADPARSAESQRVALQRKPASSLESKTTAAPSDPTLRAVGRPADARRGGVSAPPSSGSPLHATRRFLSRDAVGRRLGRPPHPTGLLRTNGACKLASVRPCRTGL